MSKPNGERVREREREGEEEGEGEGEWRRRGGGGGERQRATVWSKIRVRFCGIIQSILKFFSRHLVK